MLCLVSSAIRVSGQAPNLWEHDSGVEGGAKYLPGSIFRVEKVPISVGAELITIFAERPRSNAELQGPETDIPLVSVLRDTLGDEIPENDRLRYVWMLSYTRPTLRQKAAAFIPFFYGSTPNRKVGTKPPPSVIDVQDSGRIVWNKVLWYLFKKMVVGGFDPGTKASAFQFRRNSVDHRRAAVADSLAVLALFQEVEGEKVLSDSELKDIQARLELTDKPFGWGMQSENLERLHEAELRKTRDFRGQNWELLRRYSEEQGLYFEPLEMQDGYARHAIVWTTEEDIKANQGKAFESRFLNLKNPWRDKRLVNWEGYKKVRWYDSEDRVVEPGTPGAKAKTMIPLALYGLDNPKIPVILIDFRDSSNPRMRELSRRVLADVSNSILTVTRFNSFPYFIGRYIYDFVTDRRGMDLNQASRFRSYSQLKLLVALDESLEPGLKEEVSRHIDHSGINPMENGVDTDSQIAVKQYANLLAYARRPDGLSKKILNDRLEEMARIKHSRPARVLLTVASVFTLGLYRHRESETPYLIAQMDRRRQLDFHERFLRQVAFASVGPEVDSNMEQLRRSLDFIAQNGAAADEKTSRALARIFAVSRTEDTRDLCLAGLYRINSSSAKKELLAIYYASPPAEKWKTISARYLKLALEEGQRISPRDVSSITAINAAATN